MSGSLVNSKNTSKNNDNDNDNNNDNNNNNNDNDNQHRYHCFSWDSSGLGSDWKGDNNPAHLPMIVNILGILESSIRLSNDLPLESSIDNWLFRNNWVFGRFIDNWVFVQRDLGKGSGKIL